MRQILYRLKYFAAMALFLLTSTVMSVGPVALSGRAFATSKNDDNITICHATNSDTNPYTNPTVDPDGLVNPKNAEAAHLSHTGPVWNPTLKDQHISWGDIIPEFTFDGLTYSLNWDTAGQAIWNNGCKPVTTPVTPAAVTIHENCGTANDTFDIPANGNGIVYTHTFVGGLLTVTATPDATHTLTAGNGFTLNSDGTATYTHQFTNVACPCDETESNNTFGPRLLSLNQGDESDSENEECPPPNPCDEDESDVLGISRLSANHENDNDSDDENADCGGGGGVTPPPTVVVTPSACVLPLALNGFVTVKVTNPNNFAVNYTVALSGVATPQFVLVPANSSSTVTFNNLAAGTYTATVIGAGTTGTANATVATCTSGGGGGGGQVLGETTTAVTPPKVVTPGLSAGEVLANTGTSTVLPTILALSLALTATGVMFGSRKYRNQISVTKNSVV